MQRQTFDDHPIRQFFSRALHDCLSDKLQLTEAENVEPYLVNMLVNFIHQDAIFTIRDCEGRRLSSFAEMIAEGDIRLNANSFDRERQVHRHIGDLLLFWSGLFPEFVQKIKSAPGPDALLNPVEQGRMSYYVASTFDQDPYTQEARVLRTLSEGFEDYRYGLALVRASFEGFARQGWPNGFEA
jgi:hypothetical protein